LLGDHFGTVGTFDPECALGVDLPDQPLYLGEVPMPLGIHVRPQPLDFGDETLFGCRQSGAVGLLDGFDDLDRH
jgi:hypothetical protein